MKALFIKLSLLFLSVGWANAQQTTISTTEKKVETVVAKKDEKPAPAFGIKFSGFVRNDLFLDTRQMVGSRENQLTLWPADISLVNGADQNAKASLGMQALTTRLSANITGPDAFGAKTSGLIEFEFYGAAISSTDAMGGARLRHAMVKLDWPKTQLMFGQYWHPMFVTDCYPGTDAYQTLLPVNPFSRNPQIRLTQQLGSGLNLQLAMLSQNEAFTSPGPSTNVGSNGYSPFYLANNVIPNLNAHLQYKSPSFIAGVLLDYKQLRPVLAYDGTVSGTSFQAYARINTKSVVVKAMGTWGQNLADMVMLGGYAMYGANSATTTATYKPTSTNSYWIELHGTGKKVVPGICFAYTQNAGTGNTDLPATVYGRGIAFNGTAAVANTSRGIDNIMKVVPRVDFISGKFKFGVEWEYSQAAWGKLGNDLKVTGTTDNLSNSRFLFVTQYNF